jgi:hypothetical protein
MLPSDCGLYQMERAALARQLFRYLLKEEFTVYQASNNRTSAVVEQASTVSVLFETFPIRIVDEDGKPWFVAKDVAPILGYQQPRSAVRYHVSHSDRKGVLIFNPLGGPQTLTAINESGLYSLILNSVKPEARKFRDWLTSDVLPTLRRWQGSRHVSRILGKGRHGLLERAYRGDR